MTIRSGTPADFKQLISLYRSFFEVHNQFQKSDEQVLSYLKKKVQQDDLLVLEDNNLVKAVLFLVKKTKNPAATHKLFKLRHFAFDSLSAAKTLLEETENRIKAQAHTVKIEVTLAENEEGLEFYKESGYILEGTLSNHYRWGENCLILGKSLQ